MWSRVIEFMLACWLAMSPFIFGHDPSAVWLWRHDFAVASLIALLALGSYWNRTRFAHLLIVPVALWLVGFGRFGISGSPTPGMQNLIMIGLLLLMFAIVPNHASRAPELWYRETGSTGNKGPVGS